MRVGLRRAPRDCDPATGRGRLSYKQAETLFAAASGGATLHQLRHSALTHDAAAGTGALMLQASGHQSARSLEHYVRRVPEPAIARHLSDLDARQDW